MFRFKRPVLSQRAAMLIAFPLLILSTVVHAQTTAPSASTAPATATAPAPQPTTLPAFTGKFPAATIISDGENALTTLQTIDGDLASNPVMDAITQDFNLFKNQLASSKAETERDLSVSTSLDSLRSIETNWSSYREQLNTWSKQLKDRSAELDAYQNTTGQIITDWSGERTAAHIVAPPLLPELADKINTVLYAANKTNTQLQQQRADVLQYQIQVSTLQTEVKSTLDHIRTFRDAALDHMLTRDSTPIWDPATYQFSEKHNRSNRKGFSDQLEEVTLYFHRQSGRFIAQAFLLIVLAFGLFWAKARFQSWEETEPSLTPAAPVFVSPLITTLVLSLVLGIWLQPQAPRLFWIISAAIAIIPAAILIRRLTEDFVHPILYALVGFFFFDQIRSFITFIPHGPRLLFLLEMAGAAAFTAWFIYTTRTLSSTPPVVETSIGSVKTENRATNEIITEATSIQERRHRRIRLVCQLVFIFFFVSLVANITGFLSLSIFIGNTLLRASYIGLVLYAGLAVTDGVVIVFLHVKPVHRLRAIKDFSALIRARIRWALSWAAIIYWVTTVLDLMLIREPVFYFIHHVLTASYSNATKNAETGLLNPDATLSISLGKILAFILAIWGSFLLSRFLRFVLREEVYPNVKLPRGMGSAINSLVHYTLIVLGVAYGAVYLGVSVSSLTILTGAFGVGLGFGLQTIINNFFSGLILLGERPIQVGDVIEMDAMVGTVTRIGIRASIIRTPNGSEIIMPNGRLISEKVINWTLTDRARGIDISVTVDGAADPMTVMKILEKAANEHDQVVDEPSAMARFASFGPGVATYSLRVWTTEVADWSKVQSQLGLAIRKALDDAHIALK